jgi:hypothetical protein
MVLMVRKTMTTLQSHFQSTMGRMTTLGAARFSFSSLNTKRLRSRSSASVQPNVPQRIGDCRLGNNLRAGDWLLPYRG